jgi:pyruvate,water dikinase
MDNEPIILPLTEVDRDLLLLVGGKGANLGEMTRARLPVPPGFCITTVAYARVAAEAHIEPLIAELEHMPPDLIEPLSTHASHIRDLIESTPIPASIADAITAAYRQLGEGVPVAVRSSATAEDLPEAAFAGQQDTFLNIVGAEALRDAVRRCWASLWTERAIVYRKRQRIDQRTVQLAVVVQRMVTAEAAGVLFTANPVTGARDEIVVDASPGLGEAIVSGLVTPDHFVLDKRSGLVKERQPGRREVVIRARSGGGTEQVEGSAVANMPALPGRALRQLARLGTTIEQHFGRPQDVEWTRAGGELFIVQARPMTALPEPPPHPSRPVRMLSAMFAEMFPVRPYPLDQTTWVHSISAAAVEPIFGLIGIAVPPIEQMFVEEDGVVVRFSGKIAFHPTPAILLAPVRLLWLASRYDPVRWRADPLLAEGRSRANALGSRELGQLSWEGLLATVRETLALALPLAGEVRRRYFPRVLLAAGLLRVALAMLGHGKRFGTLLSGVESTTIEANRSLEALAAHIRSDPTLADAFARHAVEELRAALEQQTSGRVFLSELQTFLDRYGHREIVLSTVLQPTWKDAPELVLGIVKGLALTEPRHETGRPAWEVARDTVLAHPLLRFSPLRFTTLKLLTTARSLWQIREDTHFDATRILPILRRTLFELGRRLVGAGVLDTPEDVFHLKLDELKRVGGTWPPSPELVDELRAIVLRRRERRSALEGKPVVDPRLYRHLEPGGEALLRGTAGSPGVAEGPVRIIRDSSEFGKLRSGEVLVAPYTNPSWTPLFQRAVAVVVDGGGAGSHAAIVAREYGIPAVMGTIDGTHRLADGQRVRVDGDHGRVTHLD